MDGPLMRRGLMSEVSGRVLVVLVVLVWSLAEQTGLTGLVQFQTSKVRSGAVDPADKLACVIAGMTAGGGVHR